MTTAVGSRPRVSFGAMQNEDLGRVMQMLNGHYYSYFLIACVRLGLPDRLREGPLPLTEIAESCSADEESLYRLLRALTLLGICDEPQDRQFGLTGMGRCLLADTAGELRSLTLLQSEPSYRAAWEGLAAAVRTGRCAFEAANGAQLFEYLDEHPEERKLFQSTLTGPPAWNDAIVDAYDFSRFGTVVDVGGGEGALVRAIVEANESASGIVFDRPAVVDAARAELRSVERIEWVGGDFLTAVPTADVCLLRYILHDWDDDVALRILRSCRAAVNESGRILIIEHILTREDWSASTLLDVTMLVLSGGRERSLGEYEALLRDADLEVGGVTQTAAGVSIIEGRPR